MVSVDKAGAARYHMGNFIKTVDAALNTDVDRAEEESLENLIELSAEGARRKPNLSGKRTEVDSAQAESLYWSVTGDGCTLFVFQQPHLSLRDPERVAAILCRNCRFG